MGDTTDAEVTVDDAVNGDGSSGHHCGSMRNFSMALTVDFVIYISMVLVRANQDKCWPCPE